MKRETSEVLLIATLFGVLFLSAVDNQLLIPLLPLLSIDLDVSIESLGRLFSAYALAAALFNIAIGPLTDRFGRVPFLRTGLLVFALAALATYMSEGYGQLLIMRSITGLAAAVLSTCTASLIGDLFPYHRRGRVMGIVLSAYFLALIVGIPIGATIAEFWDWHAVFLATTALSLALWLRSLISFPKPAPRTEDHDPNVFAAYPRFFTNRVTLGGLVTSFATSGATLAFLTFIAAHLSSRFSATPVQVSWLFVISGVGAVGGSFFAGWLSDRIGKRSVFLLANTILVLPLLILDRLPMGGLMAAVFLAISLLVASRQTALQTIQTQLVPHSRRGAFLGLRNGMSQMGISSAVFVAGSLYTASGYGAVATFAATLTVFASLVFFFAVKEPVAEEK